MSGGGRHRSPACEVPQAVDGAFDPVHRDTVPFQPARRLRRRCVGPTQISCDGRARPVAGPSAPRARQRPARSRRCRSHSTGSPFHVGDGLGGLLRGWSPPPAPRPLPLEDAVGHIRFWGDCPIGGHLLRAFEGATGTLHSPASSSSSPGTSPGCPCPHGTAPASSSRSFSRYSSSWAKSSDGTRSTSA